MKKTNLSWVGALLVFALLLWCTAATPGKIDDPSTYTCAVYSSALSLLPPVIAIVLALNTKEVYTSLLVGIASIALVVGGIGIMNMMLVTVTERTTEIGLRKALGAEPGQIQMQFLIEAIILSLLGGVIGVIVGLSVSFAICMNTDITFSLNTFAIGLGVGFSAAVGIIFGWAPARKASRLNPIDALRSM